jgi:hypothetical protein
MAQAETPHSIGLRWSPGFSRSVWDCNTGPSGAFNQKEIRLQPLDGSECPSSDFSEELGTNRALAGFTVWFRPGVRQSRIDPW